MIAMAGDECIAIAADRRLGVQYQTVSCEFQKLFQINDKTFVGLAGLATDVQTVAQTLKFRNDLYELREDRKMTPKVFSSQLSALLYEKRFGPFFVEPIVAGLDASNKPYLSGMDLIGAPCFPDDYVVSGTCTANLHGMCETLYRPGLGPDELFETISQALLAGVDRDALSGWGAIIHVITKDGVTTRELKGRMD